MNKQIQTLGLTLLILFGLIFLVANPLEKGAPEKPLFNFTKSDIAAFKIENFTQGLSFENKGGDWTVKKSKTKLAAELEKTDNSVKSLEGQETDPVKADPVKIASILTRLETTKVTEPISSEVGSQSLFQINAHSLQISLYDNKGGELGRLYVGKNGPDMMSSYVKRDKENDVYLVGENFQSLLLLPFEQWLYKEAESFSDNASDNVSAQASN